MVLFLSLLLLTISKIENLILFSNKSFTSSKLWRVILWIPTTALFTALSFTLLPDRPFHETTQFLPLLTEPHSRTMCPRLGKNAWAHNDEHESLILAFGPQIILIFPLALGRGAVRVDESPERQSGRSAAFLFVLGTLNTDLPSQCLQEKLTIL